MLKNRFKGTLSYLRKQTLSDGLPIEFSIELTSRCNLKCVMCPRSDDSERGVGNMSFETFKRIVDDACGYTELAYLHLAGESLLHPSFGEFIHYAASKGLTPALSTNGTVMDRRRADILIESPLDHLIISIDGTDPETYKYIRGADSFEKVVSNAKAFLDRKREAGRGPYTILQLICMNENSHQTKEFVRYWRSLGADAVRLKRFFNFGGKVEDKSYDQPDLVGIGSPRKAVEQKASTDKARQPCFLLWRQLAFYYDGTVVSCCYDFLHDSVVGNIHENSIAEIWNSKPMVEMRRLHIEGRQSEIPLCSGCNQPLMGVPGLLTSSILSATKVKRLLIWVERGARLAGLRSPY